MKTIQAILFDMDGTLVDSERVGQKAWAATADEMGIEIPCRFRARGPEGVGRDGG